MWTRDVRDIRNDENFSNSVGFLQAQREAVRFAQVAAYRQTYEPRSTNLLSQQGSIGQNLGRSGVSLSKHDICVRDIRRSIRRIEGLSKRIKELGETSWKDILE